VQVAAEEVLDAIGGGQAKQAKGQLCEAEDADAFWSTASTAMANGGRVLLDALPGDSEIQDLQGECANSTALLHCTDRVLWIRHGKYKDGSVFAAQAYSAASGIFEFRDLSVRRVSAKTIAARIRSLYVTVDVGGQLVRRCMADMVLGMARDSKGGCWKLWC
jgi:hypothetical protein